MDFFVKQLTRFAKLTVPTLKGAKPILSGKTALNVATCLDAESMSQNDCSNYV